MTKDARSVWEDFVCFLTGRKVSYASLFLNSLRICIDRQLKEPTGFFLWFEPVWQVGAPEGILAGSRQAQTEDRDAHAAINRIVEELVGREIERISLDDISCEIGVRLAGGYWVRTFVSDPTADEDWYVRDCASNVVISGSAKGLRVSDRGPHSEETA